MGLRGWGCGRRGRGTPMREQVLAHTGYRAADETWQGIGSAMGSGGRSAVVSGDTWWLYTGPSSQITGTSARQGLAPLALSLPLAHLCLSPTPCHPLGRRKNQDWTFRQGLHQQHTVPRDRPVGTYPPPQLLRLSSLSPPRLQPSAPSPWGVPPSHPGHPGTNQRPSWPVLHL